MFLGKSENTAGPEISKIRTPEKKPLESKQVGFSRLSIWFGSFLSFFGIWGFLFVFYFILTLNEFNHYPKCFYFNFLIANSQNLLLSFCRLI